MFLRSVSLQRKNVKTGKQRLYVEQVAMIFTLKMAIFITSDSVFLWVCMCVSVSVYVCVFFFFIILLSVLFICLLSKER